MIRSVFIDDNGQLRSGWRATVYLAAFVILTIVVGAIGQTLTASLGLVGPKTFLLTSAATSLLVALGVGWACLSIFERLPFAALGASFTRSWFVHWLYGVILGGLTLIVPLCIAVALGGLSFEFNFAADTFSILRSLAVSFIVFAAAAAFEEALFRGYVLQTFARAGLAWLAIVLTSAFFGGVHLGNPAVSTIAALNTVLAGVWFSLAYLKTRDLWFVWGIHFMWNWLQGAVFGIEVSGLTEIASAPLLKEVDRGPTWLTGTDYGIEGSIITTFAILLAIAAIRYLPGLIPDPQLLAMTSPQATEPVKPTVS